MKKAIYLVAAGLFIMSASSCTKEYTCECTTTDSADSSVNSSISYTFEAKKKDADAACTNYNVTSGTQTTSCKLK